MNRFLTSIIALAFCLSAGAQNTPQIIPQPETYIAGHGTFDITGITVKIDPAAGEKTAAMVNDFVEDLSNASGVKSKVKTGAKFVKRLDKGSAHGMCFVEDRYLAPEAYDIEITHKFVVVRASDYNGFLYAVQTLRQMLPEAIYTAKPASGKRFALPCCRIKDAPRFAYRGMHMDCCRHFFSTGEVRKYLEVMSMYKLNRFHWHLSDDQGWRIEIEKYPKLTEVGAYREGTQVAYDTKSSDGVRYGGYYTKEEIRGIIRFADSLGITIVPEIDLPGHMLAALAAYPEYGCAGSAPYKVWTRWGISKQVLCVGKEETMTFLEDILSEVAELFPGEYVHIGGDECPKDEWKTDPDCQARIRELGLVSDDRATAEQRLQNYVTARMQKFLAGKGKKIIGWDEVLEGELAEGATVMSWRGVKGGVAAAKAGYDVIMTPNTYCYFDYAQSENLDAEPLGITRNPKRALTLEKVYGYEPYEDLDPAAQKHILGVQANLWTEYIASPEHLEYMLLPRMLALSEVQWCPQGKKDFARFETSLKDKQFKILDLLGYKYRKQ